MNLIIKRLFLVLPVVLLVFAVLHYSNQNPNSTSGRQNACYTKSGLYFDTVIQITILDDLKEAQANKYLNTCMEIAERYEKLLSVTVQGSDIWNLNHSDGNWVTVSEDTLQVLSAALTYADISDGRLTPSIGALSSLWDFTGTDSSEKIPSADAILHALRHIDYRDLETNSSSLRVRKTDPEMTVDLGCIAKGYIADKMKEYLVSEGIGSGIINLGGNVLTIGKKPDGTPFRIGLKKPFTETGEIIETVDAEDLSVVSSGIYERYFEKDGSLYHHILSVNTGFPIDNDLYEVTILSKSSMQGDALSTLCMILGKEEGIKFIQSLPEIEAIFIDRDFRIYDTRKT